MEIEQINGVNYLIPAEILEHNSCSDYTYGSLFLSEVFTGQEDFDRLYDLGFDFTEHSECFAAYSHAMGINEDDVNISDVASSLFGMFVNHDGDEFELHMLLPA